MRVRATIAIAILLAGICLSPAGGWAQSRAPAAPSVNRAAVYRFTAAMFGLDPDLLEAIAKVESGGDPSAVSPKGAEGVMQLMPGTAHQVGVNDPFNPVQNIFGAGLFLAWLKWNRLGQPRHPANLVDLLAAYNAGPGAVQKYGGVPPYSETQQYVRRVLVRYLFGITLPAAPGRSMHRHAAKGTGRKIAHAWNGPAQHMDPLEQLGKIRRGRALAQCRLTAPH